MVVLGLIMNRINVSLVGIMRGAQTSYLPNWQEIWVSVFIVVTGGIAFGVAAKWLPVFEPEDESESN